MYGRRRTGKTALLRRFSRDRRAVFFVADSASAADQRSAFCRALAAGLDDPALADASFPTWEAALRFVASRAVTEPLLLVLDEFPYLCNSDTSLPSVLQRLWDAELKEGRLHIALCGSLVAFMERQVLGARSPLYGRRTGAWLLEPMPFSCARLFFPSWPVDRQLEAWGVVGGIPAYLERFDPEVGLDDNILTTILTRGAPLYDEPRFLMLEELREPATYFSVCRAIALGRGTPNEIAQAAGLPDRGPVSRYLDMLREMRLVRRDVPATERNPERTRRGRWRLSDPFLRFWFRFVLPERSALESGDATGVLNRRILPHLAQHISVAFEDACRQHMLAVNAAGLLSCRYARIGAWWRGSEEVDIVAVADGGPLLLGECKWSTRRVGVDVLDNLQRKAPLVCRDLRGEPTELEFALFSRAGFTDALRKRASAEGVRLVGLDAIATGGDHRSVHPHKLKPVPRHNSVGPKNQALEPSDL